MEEINLVTLHWVTQVDVELNRQQTRYIHTGRIQSNYLLSHAILRKKVFNMHYRHHLPLVRSLSPLTISKISNLICGHRLMGNQHSHTHILLSAWQIMTHLL